MPATEATLCQERFLHGYCEADVITLWASCSLVLTAIRLDVSVRPQLENTVRVDDLGADRLEQVHSIRVEPIVIHLQTTFVSNSF